MEMVLLSVYDHYQQTAMEFYEFELSREWSA